MSAASVTTSCPRAWQAFLKICIFFLSMRYVGCFNDLKSGMSFDSAVSMPRNCVVTTACEGKGIPSAPPENSLNSSSSSTDISQAWQSPSLVERFQAQLNCAPLPMSLHNKDANKNAASVKQPKTKPTQMERIEKMVKTTFHTIAIRHTQHVRLKGPEPRWSDIMEMEMDSDGGLEVTIRQTVWKKKKKTYPTTSWHRPLSARNEHQSHPLAGQAQA